MKKVEVLFLISLILTISFLCKSFFFNKKNVASSVANENDNIQTKKNVIITDEDSVEDIFLIDSVRFKTIDSIKNNIEIRDSMLENFIKK